MIAHSKSQIERCTRLALREVGDGTLFIQKRHSTWREHRSSHGDRKAFKSFSKIKPSGPFIQKIMANFNDKAWVARIGQCCVLNYNFCASQQMSALRRRCDSFTL